MFAREIKQVKKQRQMVEAHKRSTYSTLWEAYKKPSEAKKEAFNYCKSKQKKT